MHCGFRLFLIELDVTGRFTWRIKRNRESIDLPAELAGRAV